MLVFSISGFLTFLQTSLFVIGYISKNSLFPEPLNAEEEKMYLQMLENGDKEARTILIERNLRLVAHVCKKYSNNNTDLDDLISIGTIGLIKGIDSFNYKKGVRLATYVSRCIDNEILMFLRKNKRKRAEVSLEDALNYDAEGNELKLSDVVGTEEDIVDRQFQDKMNREFLANEINNLSKRDKEIMMLRYGLNNTKEYTQKEVANMLGISQSYISRIEKKVINEISKVIN